MSWNDYHVHIDHTQKYKEGGYEDQPPFKKLKFDPKEKKALPKRNKSIVKQNLPPWMDEDQIDDNFTDWEATRNKRIQDMRMQPDYKFVMEVSAFTNEKLDKYWNGPNVGGNAGSGIRTTAGYIDTEDKDIVVPGKILKDIELQAEYTIYNVILQNIDIFKNKDFDFTRLINKINTEYNNVGEEGSYAEFIVGSINACKRFIDIQKRNYAFTNVNTAMQWFEAHPTMRNFTDWAQNNNDKKKSVIPLRISLKRVSVSEKEQVMIDLINSTVIFAFDMLLEYYNLLGLMDTSAYVDRDRVSTVEANINNMKDFILMFKDRSSFSGFLQYNFPKEFIRKSPFWNFSEINYEEVSRQVNLYRKRKLQQRAHNWMMSNPWSTERMYYSPMLYGHMQEGHLALSSKYHHLKKITINDIISDKTGKPRTLFAKLVSLLIRKSEVISSKRYHLDKSFRRLNIEIGRVFRVWKNIKVQKSSNRSDKLKLSSILRACKKSSRSDISSSSRSDTSSSSLSDTSSSSLSDTISTRTDTSGFGSVLNELNPPGSVTGGAKLSEGSTRTDTSGFGSVLNGLNTPESVKSQSKDVIDDMMADNKSSEGGSRSDTSSNPETGESPSKDLLDDIMNS